MKIVSKSPGSMFSAWFRDAIVANAWMFSDFDHKVAVDFPHDHRMYLEKYVKIKKKITFFNSLKNIFCRHYFSVNLLSSQITRFFCNFFTGPGAEINLALNYFEKLTILRRF
jgi:hypothetical protein